ncbi:MAG: hypothetical protein GTO63_15235 [Anaerolineae bacterium]|nr:hypothetical protein [Anaerolineae bacterium]NIN96184.1 hypothetical protein [Anaerolineae bacterium]
MRPSKKGLQAKIHAEHAESVKSRANRILKEMEVIYLKNPLSNDDKARLTELSEELDALQATAIASIA